MGLTGELSQAANLSGNLSNQTLRGYDAYEVAVLNGFQGTVSEWLESLRETRYEERIRSLEEQVALLRSRLSI
jgi:hypothetical protein